MSKWIVQEVESNNHSNVIDDKVDDEEFETREEAEEFADACMSDFITGADVLDDLGLSSTDPDDISYIAVEI